MAEVFGALAIAFTVLQVIALIVLHLLHTGYDPIRDAVSDYGVGPYRRWYWLQAVAGGTGCLALGIALAQLHPFTPTYALDALIATAVARYVIPFFPTDQHGSRFQTTHGVIHMLLAVIAFGGLIWAATDPWSTLRHYPAWHSAKTALTVIPWIMLGSVLAVVLALRSRRLKPFFGALERLFYISSITWVITVAVYLVRLSP